MTYPPDGCGYEVAYSLGRRGFSSERFTDEFELMRWFGEMVRRGLFAPAEFEEPDEDGRNGYRIFCVTAEQRVGISYFHPRLVRARIEGRI
ncbi:hypothetical protein BTM25_44950 [Actinomadura rubteroloni]|uniref:Uncharacterized protein n=1 Tax=Actinomadura rubteroloni TaxID=1926885 RepID=A0A2P4UEA4_9ACTN|nr:hypothetical protein [Actinomadura rubteroloni]POM23342.1 hypothetical protein BTM25_44950 [Actinomadura rubteroloni]